MEKQHNFWKFQINWSFTFRLRRSKLIIKSLPDNADDAHYNRENKIIIYYVGGKKHTVDLPAHKEGFQIHLVPLYNKGRTAYSTNRYISIKLLY